MTSLLCEPCSDKYGRVRSRCYFCKNKNIHTSFCRMNIACEICKAVYPWEYYKKIDACDRCLEAQYKAISPLNIITTKGGVSRDHRCNNCLTYFLNNKLLEHHIRRNCPIDNFETVPGEEFDWRYKGVHKKDNTTTTTHNTDLKDIKKATKKQGKVLTKIHNGFHKLMDKIDDNSHSINDLTYRLDEVEDCKEYKHKKHEKCD